MKKKIKVTVRFPKSLRQEMLSTVVDDKYGMRGKSKWVSEAVLAFLSRQSFVDMVDIGSEMSEADLSAVESFYFDQDITDKIEAAIIIVRKVNPTCEGIKSIIIRSSVLQKLFRPTN